MNRRNSTFRLGQSTFHCRACNKLTRDTGDNGSVELCDYCYEEGSLENSLQDGHISQAEFDAEIRSLREQNNRDPTTGKPLKSESVLRRERKVAAHLATTLDKVSIPVVESTFSPLSQSNLATTERNNTMTKSTSNKNAAKNSTQSLKAVDPVKAARKALMTGVCLFDNKTPTKGLFAPGHDAKLHSAVLDAFKNEKTFRATQRQMEYLKNTGWFTKELAKHVKTR